MFTFNFLYRFSSLSLFSQPPLSLHLHLLPLSLFFSPPSLSLSSIYLSFPPYVSSHPISIHLSSPLSLSPPPPPQLSPSPHLSLFFSICLFFNLPLFLIFLSFSAPFLDLSSYLSSLSKHSLSFSFISPSLPSLPLQLLLLTISVRSSFSFPFSLPLIIRLSPSSPRTYIFFSYIEYFCFFYPLHFFP